MANSMTSEEPTELEPLPEDFLSSGDAIAGRYKISYPLGAGGFAQVYLATHLEVDSLRVAVKVLHPSHLTDDTLSRFRNEAKLLARLRNRHTVRLTDFGVADDNMAYLVMEYVEGTPLDRIIYAKGALGQADTARVGIGVLKSLVEAHTVGIIHRDLKPANIMLVSEMGEKHPVPRVLDFGIAKVLGGGSPVEDHIVHADGSFEPVVYCTPAYAAPELLRGRPEFPTDLYALGLVLVEMLDGTPPYEYPDEEPAASPHLWEEPVPLGRRSARSRLAPILRRALGKELSDRYASAAEMLDDLEQAYDEIRRERAADRTTLELDAQTNQAPPTPPTPHPSRVSRFINTAMQGVANATAIREQKLSDARIAVAERAAAASNAKLERGRELARAARMRSHAVRVQDEPARAATAPLPKNAAANRTGPPPLPTPSAPAGTPPPNSGGPPPLAWSGASSDFDPGAANAPVSDVIWPLSTPTLEAPVIPLSEAHGEASRTLDAVILEAEFVPNTRTEDSRVAAIPIFGRQILSTRVTLLSVVIVTLAVLVPALITAWSVMRYAR